MSAAASVSRPRRRDVPLEVLEPQPQRRQRRPKLVRRVRDEVFLRAYERLELRRRLVQRAREPANVVRPVALGRTRIELAVADPLRRALHPPQRPGDGTGEQQAQHRGRAEHDGSGNRKPEPVADDAAVRRGGRIRDRDGAEDAAVRGDGHRDEETARRLGFVSLAPAESTTTRPDASRTTTCASLSSA